MTRKTRIRLRKLCWKGIKLFKRSKGMKKNLSPGVKKISVPFPDLLNCLPSYLSLSNVSEKQKVYTNLFFFFLACLMACRILVPQAGTEPVPLMLEAQSHHCGKCEKDTTREALTLDLLVCQQCLLSTPFVKHDAKLCRCNSEQDKASPYSPGTYSLIDTTKSTEGR